MKSWQPALFGVRYLLEEGKVIPAYNRIEKIINDMAKEEQKEKELRK